jgi:hypothetical protein
MFSLLFGAYPIFYPYFEKLARPLRIILKLVYFNVVIIGVEYLLITFFVPEDLGVPMAVVLILIGNFTFLLYDKVIPKAERLLEKSIGRLIRKF